MVVVVYAGKSPVVATGQGSRRLQNPPPPKKRRDWEENRTTMACLKKEVFSRCDGNVTVPM